MYRYAWIARLEDLGAATASLPTLIPLLHPGDPARVERWDRILSWYGLRPAAASESPSRVAAPVEARPADLIVSLDDEFTAVVSVLAAADRRPVVRVRDVAAIVAHPLLATASSLLVTGRPSQLRNRTLLELSSGLRLPWGILTGTDAPGLSFVVAKVLAARQPIPAPSGHLDAIARRQWVWPAARRADAGVELDREATWQAIRHADWETLSIHCHGDGAHANLNSIVLCGVAGAQERGFDGHPAGCAPEAAPPRCKRVHGPERRAFRFGDVRVRQMCLFTCNGFSVSGDVYPSDSSFILSACEGYPAAVLTTDRRLRFEPWVFPAVHAGLCRESLGRVGSWLNDVCAFGEGARPYLLYGDPSPFASGHSSPSDRDVPQAPSVHVSALGDLAASAAIGLDDDRERATIARGETLAVIADDGTVPDARLVDRSEAVESLERWLIELSYRSARAKQLEAAIPDYAEGALCPDTSALVAARDELARVSDRLHVGVGEGTRLLGEIRRRGVWLPAARTWQAHMRLLICVWDHQLARLIHDDLMDRHLSELLRDGFPSAVRSNGPRCPRCRCTVVEGAASPLASREALHHWIDCPTCGPREAWDSGRPRLSAQPPAAVSAGSSLDVRVDVIATSDATSLEGSGFGFLVAHLKDSGRGRVSFRAFERVGPSGTVLTIPVPEDSAPEIHTLRLALVCSLGVSYLRLRAPCAAA